MFAGLVRAGGVMQEWRTTVTFTSSDDLGPRHQTKLKYPREPQMRRVC